MPRKSRPLFHIGREAELTDLIEVKQWKQQRVADHFGVHLGTIERTVRRLGLAAQRTGPRGKEGHPNWRGGRYLVGGYWYVRADDHPNCTKAGYMAEHRLAMESKLGRLLERAEVVHHIDGNPQNNHPDNLMVFQENAQHLRHELTGRVPEWTDDGKARIRAGILKSVATRTRSKSSGRLLPRSTDHQPSSSGSNGESPASGTAQ